jgi:hypothetical protein
MGRRKKGNMLKLEDQISGAKRAKWCNVDTDNKFEFDEMRFKISETVEQYKVLDKGNLNIAQMDMILCVDDGDEMRYFDQLHVEINNELVTLVN